MLNHRNFVLTLCKVFCNQNGHLVIRIYIMLKCGRHKIQYKKNLSTDFIHCFSILQIVCIPTILSYNLVLCDSSIFIYKQCQFFM